MVVDAASVAHETKVTVEFAPATNGNCSGLQGGETVVIEGITLWRRHQG